MVNAHGEFIFPFPPPICQILTNWMHLFRIHGQFLFRARLHADQLMGFPTAIKLENRNSRFLFFPSIPHFCFSWPPNRKKASFILIGTPLGHRGIKFRYSRPHPSPISIKLFPAQRPNLLFSIPPDRPHLTFPCPPRKERWCQKREGSPSLSFYWWMERGEASYSYSIFHTWRRKNRFFVF